MHVLLVAAAALVFVALQLRGDARIRAAIYTEPLSRVPANAEALAREMIAAACEGKNMSPEQLRQVEAGIYKILSEGAVAQRNFEMERTREQISQVGLFLSWFMKQKGLSYAQIQAKYEKEFSEDAKLGHQRIIESASRTNKNLLEKFWHALRVRLGFASEAKPLTAKL